MNSNIELVLKDHSYQTELKVAKTIQDMSGGPVPIINTGRIKPKEVRFGDIMQSRISYVGHMCCYFDVPILIENLDESGVLKDNVVGVYNRTHDFYVKVFDGVYTNLVHTSARIPPTAVLKSYISGNRSNVHEKF